MSDLELREAQRNQDWRKYWALIRRANLFSKGEYTVRAKKERLCCPICMAAIDYFNRSECARCTECRLGWIVGPYWRRTVDANKIQSPRAISFITNDEYWCVCCTPLDIVLAYPESISNHVWRDQLKSQKELREILEMELE